MLCLGGLFACGSHDDAPASTDPGQPFAARATWCVPYAQCGCSSPGPGSDDLAAQTAPSGLPSAAQAACDSQGHRAFFRIQCRKSQSASEPHARSACVAVITSAGAVENEKSRHSGRCAACYQSPAETAPNRPCISERPAVSMHLSCDERPPVMPGHASCRNAASALPRRLGQDELQERLRACSFISFAYKDITPCSTPPNSASPSPCSPQR